MMLNKISKRSTRLCIAFVNESINSIRAKLLRYKCITLSKTNLLMQLRLFATNSLYGIANAIDYLISAAIEACGCSLSLIHI